MRSQRTEDGRRPQLADHLVLRPERFGAILYDPIFDRERQLDPAGALVAGMMNGVNSLSQIRAIAASRLGRSPQEAERLIDEMLAELSGSLAVTFEEGPDDDRVQLPRMAAPTPDGAALSAPKGVIWDVTQACNLSCVHCLNASGEPAADELGTEEALRLLDDLEDWPVFRVSFSGGEPFLRKDLLELLRHAAETRLHVEIATNGLVLEGRVLRALRDLPVFRIQVSIDGIGADHDRFRGRAGSWSAACRTVRRLVEEGISVVIGMTATAVNVGAVGQVADLAVRLGAGELKVIPFLPQGRGRRNAERLRLDGRNMLRLAKRLRRLQREMRDVLAVSTEATYAFLFEDPNPEASPGRVTMGCSAGHETLCIGADGEVYPCPFLRDFPVGNVRETPLREMWFESPVLEQLRAFRREHLSSPCSECPWCQAPCRGGCRAAAWFEHGDLRAPDPGCIRRAMA